MSKQAVLETLAFFDAQHRPLSLMEIKLHLPPGEKNPGLKELESLLESGELEGEVASDGVFYCLKGREELLRARHERYRTSLERMRRAKKFVYFLRFVPYVRAAAISGSQALLNSRKDSDIDLFIITAKNRIWLARTLVTLFFQITASRRHGNKTSNRFCLNHYIDERLEMQRDQNLYTAMLYANFLPAFGLEHFGKFYYENQWLREHLGHFPLQSAHNFFRYERPGTQRFLEWFLEITLQAPLLNSLSRWYQKSRIEKQDFVFVSDQELSFHPNSRGQKILSEFSHNRLRLIKK